MKKFLYFSKGGGEDAVDDIALYPAESFRGAAVAVGAGDAVSLGLHFKSIKYMNQDEADALYDQVDLTIGSDKHLEVIDAIYEAIENSDGEDGSGVIVVADETNSKYISTDVTACVAITFTA